MNHRQKRRSSGSDLFPHRRHDPLPDMLKYRDDETGYSGKVYIFTCSNGEQRFELYGYLPNGIECLHSFSSDVKDMKSLREFVEDLPETYETPF